MASKKIMKFRPPWAPNTEFEIPVDGLSEGTIAELLSKGSSPDVDGKGSADDYEEVEGPAPKQPVFAEGEGPEDAEKVRVSIGKPIFAQASNVSPDVEQYNRDAGTLSPSQMREKYGDKGPVSPEAQRKRNRDNMAQKLGAKDYASLNPKQKAQVMEHLQDATEEDLDLSLGDRLKSNIPFIGGIGLADKIMGRPDRAEAYQQGLTKLPGKVGDAVMGAVKGVGSFLMPELSARLAAEKAGSPQAPQAPEVVEQAPAVAADAPPIATDIPIQEPGQPPQPQTPQVQASQVQDPYDAIKQSNERQADIAARMGEDISKAKIDQGKIAQHEAALLQQQQERQGVALKKLRSAYETTLDAMNDPALKVNPDNFWASRSTPQKLAAAIGIFLGGLGKGPNEALKIIDRAIARDMEAQQANLLSKREGLKAKAAGQLQVMGMLRDQGVDEFNQIKLGTAAMYDGLSKQIEGLKAQGAGQQQLAMLDGLQAEIDLKRDKNIRESMEHTSRLEHQAAQTEELKAQAALNRAKAMQDKKAPPQALKAMTEVQQLEEGLRTIMEQEDAFKQTATGPLPQQANKAAQILDFTGKSATSKYDARRMEAAYKIHRALEPGSRAATDKDLQITAEQVLPTVTDPTGQYKFEGLRRSAVRKLLTYIKEAKALGYDTSEAEVRVMPLVRQAMER